MSDLDSHEDEKSMLRIADDMNLSDIRIQKRWVSAEDEAIRRHVQTNGEDNWAAVSLVKTVEICCMSKTSTAARMCSCLVAYQHCVLTNLYPLILAN